MAPSTVAQLARPLSMDALATAPSELLDLLPVAVYLVDASGRIIGFNARAAALWGRAPRLDDDTIRYCGSLQAYRLDGSHLPLDEVPMAEVLATGLPARDRELEIERPDGSRVTVLANVEPLRDASGRLIGAINCLQDITGRAATDRALRRSQKDLEDFFENGAVGLHLVAADGTILKANQAELDMLGYTAEEYIGQPIARFHADRPVINDILRRLSSGERLDRYPARLRAKDGSFRHVLISSNVHFRNGEFLNTRCFTVDVTDWREAEVERHAIERRLQATLDVAPVGIAETDAEGRYVLVNPAMERITGYSAAELLEMRFADLTHPDDRDEDEARYRRQLATCEPYYAVDKRYLRKDGSTVHVQVMSTAVCDANGRFEYAVRVVQDVSERVRAAEELATSERRMRELFDALPIAIYTTDAQGRITFFNRASVEFSGREPQIGSDTWCVTWKLYELDGTPLPHDACPMAVTLQTGVEVRGALALAERPDGTRVPFSPFPKLLRNEAGEIVGAINMLVDMSERLASEQSQRILIDELNHRVKNTLTTVQSIAVQTMRATPDAFIETFEGRLQALSRAHNLLTRRRWGGVDIRELLDEQLEAYARQGDRLQLHGPEAIVTPRVGLLLGMLVHELATNAAKYGALSPAGGQVRLEWDIAAGAGGDRLLRMRWRESGGPSVSPPTRHGFGTRLLERSVTRDLRGQVAIRFPTEGVECDIEFALR